MILSLSISFITILWIGAFIIKDCVGISHLISKFGEKYIIFITFFVKIYCAYV